MNAKTNRISAQLGFWAAVLSTVAFLVYTVSFAAILRTGPALVWTNLAEYVAAVRQTNQFWKHLAQLSMLLFAPLFLVLLHSIHELAPRPKQPLSRIAISFGLGFAILFGAHYFVQLSAVRLRIAAGAVTGLEQLITVHIRDVPGHNFKRIAELLPGLGHISRQDPYLEPIVIQTPGDRFAQHTTPP